MDACAVPRNNSLLDNMMSRRDFPPALLFLQSKDHRLFLIGFDLASVLDRGGPFTALPDYPDGLLTQSPLFRTAD
jgi:hypothetical protein